MKDIPVNGEVKLSPKKWDCHWRRDANGNWVPQFRKRKRKRFYATTPKK